MNHLVNAAELARSAIASPPVTPVTQQQTTSSRVPLQQREMMFHWELKKANLDCDVSPPLACDSNNSSPPRVTDRKSLKVTPRVHEELLARAQATGKSIDEVIEILLAKTSPSTTFIPRGTGSNKGIALVQMTQMKQLESFLHCPKHALPLVCQFSVRGQSPYIKMACPAEESCRYSFWGTETYENGCKKFSKSLVANQLVLAATTQNSSFGEYERLCLGLALAPVSRSYYHQFRTLVLREVIPIWESQEPLYQQLAQSLNDRDLEMDGSFSQRRNAEHCFVNLLSSDHHLIVLSTVGSRKELNVSSQSLELELCTQSIIALSNSPLKPRSITHDEHTAVTKMMGEMKHLMPRDFQERHDGWHRKKNVAKYLPDYLARNSQGLSKLSMDTICNNVLMYLNSAFHRHKGDPEGFGAAIAKIGSYFATESHSLRAAIAEFFNNFFPADLNGLYISSTSTSTLEAFNGHHHQFVGKARYLNLYRERTYLHNLMWNAARLRDLPQIPQTEGLMFGEDWLRRLQGILGLVILCKDTLKKTRQVARRKIRKAKNNALPRKSCVQDLLEEEENCWTVR